MIMEGVKMKKTKIFIMLFAIIMSIIPQNVFAKSTIETGSYISMGVYGSNPVLWRCVGNDENGRLMVSDSIICFKAFDAKGEHTPSSRQRNSGGSNMWSQSNIRAWLNSEDNTVEYPCGNVPSSENVWNGYNPYDKEAGFLTNFTEVEKNLIKAVQLKTPLNNLDKELADGDYNGTSIDFDWNVKSEKKSYQNTTDKIFLLDESQLMMMKTNLKDDFYANISVLGAVGDYENTMSNNVQNYFLRSPNTYEGSSEAVCGVSVNGEDVSFDQLLFAYGSFGIRPAFYIADNVNFEYGTGTKSDPYRVLENTVIQNPTEESTGKILVVKTANGLEVYADNNKINFPDAKPFIDENGRTLIPIRAIAEDLKYDVAYDDVKRIVTVKSDTTVVKLTIGDNKLYKNNDTIMMDTAVAIIEDRTYIPLRFVGEALGYEVEYSESITGYTLNDKGEYVPIYAN